MQQIPVSSLTVGPGFTSSSEALTWAVFQAGSELSAALGQRVCASARPSQPVETQDPAGNQHVRPGLQQPRRSGATAGREVHASSPADLSHGSQ